MKAQNLILALAAALTSFATVQASTSQVDVKAAARVSGTYTENLSERGEANQSADWGSTLTFTHVAGTNGGTYTMSAPDDGSVFTPTGTWSVSCSDDGKDCGLYLSGQDGDTFSVETVQGQISVEGDHGESNGVFNRN